MSFYGVQEIIENCNYLSALNDEDSASTEILKLLPSLNDPKLMRLQDKLRQTDALGFDNVFEEETGFFFFVLFLQQGYGVDKAYFIKDVEKYTHMHFEAARVKVARLIFQRYLTSYGLDMKGTVFENMRRKTKADREALIEQQLQERKVQEQQQRGKAGGDGKAASTVAVLSAGGSFASRGAASGAEKGDEKVIDLSHEDDGSPGNSKSDKNKVRRRQRAMSKSAKAEMMQEADDEGGEDMATSGDENKEEHGDVPAPAPAPAPAPTAAPAGAAAPSSAAPTHQSSSSQLQLASARGPDSQGSGLAPMGAGGSLAAESADDSEEAKIRKKRTGTAKELVPVKSNSIEVGGPLVDDVRTSLEAGKAARGLFQNVARYVRQLLVREAFPAFLNSVYYWKFMQTKALEERVTVSLADFQLMRVLGRGGFGTVYACRKINSGKLYALKQISKRLVKSKRAVSMTVLERHALALINSRFVCSLAYAFQDANNLYLVMDLMAGGDLKFHLTRSKQNSNGFSEERARFHAAEIVLGLEAMHAKSIIFRDLKLENVLLDEDGHCRLSDLGLVAVYGKKKVSHYAGTPGYIAPEVAQKQAYGPSADFFSLGVTLYRMLSARKPFRGNTRADFDRAVCTEEPPYDPNVFSPTAISLLKGLLAKDPAKRLGARGTQEIKDHPFFASIDWGLLEVGYLDPPFVPSRHDVNANSIEDITRDDDAKEYERIYLDEKFHKQTADFDYVSPDALRREIVAALRKEMELERTRNLDVAGKPNKCCVIL